MTIKNILEEEYDKLSDTSLSNEVKLNALNNIIQIKIREPNFKRYYYSLYKDLKLFISLSLEIAESGDFRYDHLKIDSYIELASKLELDERIKLTEIYIRKLEQGSFKNEIKVLQSQLYYYLCQKELKKFTLWSPIKLLFFFSQINVYTLLFTFFLILIITVLIPLNSPFEFMAWLNFEIEYENIASNKFTNHFLNITSKLLGLDIDFTIIGNNILSQLILIFGHIFVLVFVTTTLFNKLVDYIKR